MGVELRIQDTTGHSTYSLSLDDAKAAIKERLAQGGWLFSINRTLQKPKVSAVEKVSNGDRVQMFRPISGG
jgi:molybdopterin converting factor small subunit